MSLPTVSEVLDMRVRHKLLGWTGRLVVDDCYVSSHGSHTCNLRLAVVIVQDPRDEDGKYHEDPWVENLKELEVLL
jgi:hypothetical protein